MNVTKKLQLIVKSSFNAMLGAFYKQLFTKCKALYYGSVVRKQ